MDSQLSLLDPEESVAYQPIVRDRESFGCCALYRECSNAGKCIQPDEHSTHCDYRKHLEDGNILYGKNASNFNSSLYEQFLNRIDSLSPGPRKTIDNLLIYCLEYYRGRYQCIVRNESISRLSSVGLFKFELLGSRFLKNCSYSSYLLPIFKKSPLYEWLLEKWNAKRLYPEKKFKTPKDFFLYWLDHDGTFLRDYLAEPYRLAVLPLENVVYAEEIYHNTLRNGFNNRIYPLSPLAEDGLLSSADYEEEISFRAKMSHGCLSEENNPNTILQTSTSPLLKSHLTKPKTLLNPFMGKVCVISGSLASMKRKDAFFKIRLCGGEISDNPVNTMDILILGRQEWSELNGGIASHKVQKAAELQQANGNIEIISEDDFYAALENISGFYGNPYILPSSLA